MLAPFSTSVSSRSLTIGAWRRGDRGLHRTSPFGSGVVGIRVAGPPRSAHIAYRMRRPEIMPDVLWMVGRRLCHVLLVLCVRVVVDSTFEHLRIERRPPYLEGDWASYAHDRSRTRLASDDVARRA